MEAFRLDGKVAVVTGAGSGIGQAIALLFAKQGANVQVLDVNLDHAEGTAKEIQRLGGNGTAFVCDVAQGKQVRGTFEEIFSRTGRIDVSVNNAGIAHIGNVETTSEEDMDRLFAVNVKGVYHCLQNAVEKMQKTGGGVILNMSSTASLLGIPERFAYSMSKGAVLTMTYSIAADYLRKNIRCNCICPARIHTPFVDGYLKKTYPGKEKEMFQKLSAAQPIGRMGKPEEVAGLALYLCSDQAGFITGGAYPIDGGVISLR